MSRLELMACVALALAAAAWFHSATLFPLDRLTIYENDPAQMVWNLWIARHELLAGHSPYSTALVFPPAGANLAHHTLAAGYLPFTLIGTMLAGDDVHTFIAIYNVVLWLSLTATFVIMYLAARDLGAPPIASAGVGIAVGMSSFFKANLQNLNHVSAFFIPLIFWLVLRFYREGRARTLYGLSAVSGAAFYFTETVVFGAMMGLVALALWLSFPSGRRELVARVRGCGAWHVTGAILLALLISTPFFVAFFRDAVPAYGLEEHRRYSANLAAYFIPTLQMSPHYFPFIERWAAQVTVGVDGTWVFLGYPLLIAALAGLASIRRRERLVFAALAIVFLILGLGPFLKAFGTEWNFRLPYAWFMDYPPLRGSRTPARLVSPVIVLFGFVAAAGWAAWAARCKTMLTRSALALVAVLWTMWIGFEVSSQAAPKQPWSPPVELYKVPHGAVLTLPFEMVHGYVGLAQIVHRQPTISGSVVRLSQSMQDVWWPVNTAIDIGGLPMQAMLAEKNIHAVVLPREFPFDERAERHLQRSLEMENVLRIDSRVAPRFFPGTPAQPATPTSFAASPLMVRPSEPLTFVQEAELRATEMEVSVEPDTAWECRFFHQGRQVGTVTFAAKPLAHSSMTVRRLQLPDSLLNVPFDQVVLNLVTGEKSRLGHLHFR